MWGRVAHLSWRHLLGQWRWQWRCNSSSTWAVSFLVQWLAHCTFTVCVDCLCSFTLFTSGSLLNQPRDITVWIFPYRMNAWHQMAHPSSIFRPPFWCLLHFVWRRCWWWCAAHMTFLLWFIPAATWADLMATSCTYDKSSWSYSTPTSAFTFWTWGSDPRWIHGHRRFTRASATITYH